MVSMQFSGSGSIDDADTMGILAQHDKDMGEPAGWTKSILDEDPFSVSGDALTTYQDTWNWFEGDVKNNWASYVQKYDNITADGQSANVAAFDPNSSYTPSVDPGFTPPDTIKPFSGDASQSGSVTFAADAIQYFINNINSVEQYGSGMLLDSRTKLQNLPTLKPGLFAR